MDHCCYTNTLTDYLDCILRNLYTCNYINIYMQCFKAARMCNPFLLMCGVDAWKNTDIDM